LASERLRLGTRRVFRGLSERGWKIGVYTTSFRGTAYLRLLFALHGLRLDGIVNQAVHDRADRRGGPGRALGTKDPGAFGFDLLVDESEGVEIEAARYGFAVIRVDPGDEHWADRVLESACGFARRAH
jgi:hypothetical protein